MEAKHTPGPWTLVDDEPYIYAGREYRGGGGAAPTYVVRWYPVPA